MNNNYDYSYEWDIRYCYPHSNVLINKLGIENAEKLHIAEREITSLRIANAKVNVIKGEFDLLHLRKIHKYIFSEINVLHPFREGNGRAQRLFVEYLAENAGYRVDFSQVTDKQMIEASATSFLCDYTKMDEIFTGITEPLLENNMTQTFMG